MLLLATLSRNQMGPDGFVDRDDLAIHIRARQAALRDGFVRLDIAGTRWR